MPTLQTTLLLSIGAILGANLRYVVSLLAARLAPTGFPFGTLIINISASLLMGFFVVWSTERVLLDPRWRLFVAVGFCGSYSTYSTFAFETFALVEKSQWMLAGLNTLLTTAACFLAVVVGALLARHV